MFYQMGQKIADALFSFGNFYFLKAIICRPVWCIADASPYARPPRLHSWCSVFISSLTILYCVLLITRLSFSPSGNTEQDFSSIHHTILSYIWKAPTQLSFHCPLLSLPPLSLLRLRYPLEFIYECQRERERERASARERERERHPELAEESGQLKIHWLWSLGNFLDFGCSEWI